MSDWQHVATANAGGPVFARPLPDPDLCTVPACRGVVRTVTRVLEDGEPEPYGYCSTCGLPVTN